MQKYLGALTLVLLIGIVVARVVLLKRAGTQAMHFGRTHKRDFLILPFAIFYFYIIFHFGFASRASWPGEFFHSDVVSWIGVALCFSGLILLLLSLISFGRSFRVGIDVERPDKLVTTGIFAFSRNPIFVGFGLVLLGEFLVFPNWIPLLYLAAGSWLIHRQVLREEEFLRKHYGKEYADYSRRVRRYL